MYIVPIAWLYVALMMALAEASNSNGTMLGAVVTFALYGLLPVALVVYLMGTPARRKAARASRTAGAVDQQAPPAPDEPDPASESESFSVADESFMQAEARVDLSATQICRAENPLDRR